MGRRGRVSRVSGSVSFFGIERARREVRLDRRGLDGFVNYKVFGEK